MDDDALNSMRRALELAERGRGVVEPNPLVGAVLVKDGVVVGEGWHERFGQAHAEVNAIRAAGEAARGSTLYVTLEPCCHHGKTPPCTDAIIAAGIARVIVAIGDPFPEVGGLGAKRLHDAGIPIEFGIGAELARRQNAAYLTLLTRRRPLIHGKWAMSLDGKIATRGGDSKWISNEASRRLVHDLRGRIDGIVVGIGTALADDPLLTARPAGPRVACRVVLDSLARLPETSQLVRTARQTPTLVVVSDRAPAEAIERLQGHGCELLTLAELAGRLDIEELAREFGRRRWTNLLVEGGGDVLASFADADLLDELHVFLAPKLIGGRDAPGPLGGRGANSMASVSRWKHVETRMIEEDLYIHAWK